MTVAYSNFNHVIATIIAALTNVVPYWNISHNPEPWQMAIGVLLSTPTQNGNQKPFTIL